VFFVSATIVGIYAYYAKRFEDIETIEEVDKFFTDKLMTSEIFVERLGRLLYKYIQINEKHIAQKGRAIKTMTKLFFLGLVGLVVRFLTIVLSNGVH
jgi:hypothetical protein